MPAVIRQLVPDDAEVYIEIRQRMLRAEPWAFASSPEDANARDPEVVRRRLRGPENVIVGGYVADVLCATCAVARERGLKRRHRAWILSVYVAPEARGAGLGRGVVSKALGVARSWEGVEMAMLSVSSRTPAAQRLYESLGFAVWGVEPRAMKIGDETDEEVHMHLELGG